MKKGKFTLVQQYVIDNLINNEHLVIDDILSAISKACSEEKLNEILSILISKVKNIEIDKASSELASLANVEDLTSQSTVRVSLEIPETFYETNKRITLVRIIKGATSLDLKDAQDFENSIVLKYSEVIKLRKALRIYGIGVHVIQQLT